MILEYGKLQPLIFTDIFLQFNRKLVMKAYIYFFIFFSVAFSQPPDWR